MEANVEAEETTEAVEMADSSEAVLDVEEIREREGALEDVQERLDAQADRIEELEGLLLDLSARSADDGGTGVCPDCHGPVVKVSPLLRRSRIKCTKCGRVFHEY